MPEKNSEPKPIKLPSYHKPLLHKLSDQEFRARTRELAQVLQDIETEGAEQANAKAQAKIKMTELLTKRNNLANMVRTGETTEDVEILCELSANGEVVTERRADTLAIFDTRPPRPGERQVSMADDLFKPADASTPTGGTLDRDSETVPRIDDRPEAVDISLVRVRGAVAAGGNYEIVYGERTFTHETLRGVIGEWARGCGYMPNDFTMESGRLALVAKISGEPECRARAELLNALADPGTVGDLNQQPSAEKPKGRGGRKPRKE